MASIHTLSQCGEIRQKVIAGLDESHSIYITNECSSAEGAEFIIDLSIVEAVSLLKSLKVAIEKGLSEIGQEIKNIGL